jgi:hypothetical protein
MSPAEDARLLLAIVRRHLRGLRVGLDPAFPEEDQGFRRPTGRGEASQDLDRAGRSPAAQGARSGRSRGVGGAGARPPSAVATGVRGGGPR